MPRAPAIRCWTEPDYCGAGGGGGNAASSADSIESREGSSLAGAGLATTPGKGFFADGFVRGLDLGAAGAGSAGASGRAATGTGVAALAAVGDAGDDVSSTDTSWGTGVLGKGAIGGAGSGGGGVAWPLDGRLHTLPRGTSRPLRSSPLPTGGGAATWAGAAGAAAGAAAFCPTGPNSLARANN